MKFTQLLTKRSNRDYGDKNRKAKILVEKSKEEIILEIDPGQKEKKKQYRVSWNEEQQGLNGMGYGQGKIRFEGIFTRNYLEVKLKSMTTAKQKTIRWKFPVKVAKQ